MKSPKGNHVPRLLVVQRTSLSHNTLKSRSIGARFGPLLNYLQREGRMIVEEELEANIGLSGLDGFNAVLFNKHVSKRGVEIIRLAKKLNVCSIYDLDDWILDLPEYSVTNLSEDRLGNIVTMLHEADFVTVSNRRIKEKLSYIRSDAVFLGNGFDMGCDSFLGGLSLESEEPRVLLSNTDGIKLIRHRDEFFAGLVRFFNENPDVVFEFRGDVFPELNKIPRAVVHGFVDNARYKNEIRDAGYWFAIVPLGGTEDESTYEFNSCKSPIKYIDYGSLGIPGIYSNTPVYSDEVVDGFTGVLVDNFGDEWFKAMTRMRCDNEIRDRIRKNAYKDCCDRFGLEKSAEVLLELVYNMLEV